MLAEVWDKLDTITNTQFLSIFQGLTLCGHLILNQFALNKVLNQYILRIKPASDSNENKQLLTQKEVY